MPGSVAKAPTAPAAKAPPTPGSVAKAPPTSGSPAQPATPPAGSAAALLGSRRELHQVVLRGDHVVLEPLRPEHGDLLWPLVRAEPRSFDTVSPGAAASLGGLRSWIFRRQREESVDLAQQFLLRDPATGKPVGTSGYFNIDVRNKRVEVGHTWIASSHRRTLTNTESKLLLLQHAFEDWKAVRVQFKADVRNGVAQRALERIGAVKEGAMRNERILNDGFVRDAYVYSIIDQEWPEVKKRLHGLLWAR